MLETRLNSISPMLYLASLLSSYHLYKQWRRWIPASQKTLPVGYTLMFFRVFESVYSIVSSLFPKIFMRRCIFLLSFWSLLCIWESWPEAPSWIKGKQSVGKYFKANTGKYFKMLGNTSKSTRTAKKRRRIPSQAISCRRIWKSRGWDEPVKKWRTVKKCPNLLF